MWASIIAVAGTLAGAIVAGLLQHRSARTALADARSERRRAERITAVTTLASAVADHRRAMWVREDLRLSGAPADRIVQARDQSHTTRSAITGPYTALSLLAPALADTADAAVAASYALRDAPDTATLNTLREVSIQADAAFTEMAARLLRSV